MTILDDTLALFDGVPDSPWVTVVLVGGIGLGLASGIHALLYKRDPSSQFAWLFLCVMFPLLGAVFYFLFGLNRLKTRGDYDPDLLAIQRLIFTDEEALDKFAGAFPDRRHQVEELSRISGRVSGRPLLPGNEVVPLHNGEQAYPEMLSAIKNAEKNCYMMSYLFGTDRIGREFVDALAAATERGVDVRVLVDAVGQRYDSPLVTKLLKKKKVRHAQYLPAGASLRGTRFNLRNHRKILVVDGDIGFTGGMNIGMRHMVDDPANKNKTQDMHFRFRGPAVDALTEAFFEDWHFSTGDTDWSGIPKDRSMGNALCRAIKDGPDEDFERLQWTLVGALGCAREKACIMTPYFIPTRELLAALNAASLRGVDVRIVLPEVNNLRFVAWATEAMLPEVLLYDVKVYLQPPPFAHTKLVVVDDIYVNLGSANLDPRSLELNFELNMEVYDPELAKKIHDHFESILGESKEVTKDMLMGRSFLVKLRNNFARLFSPYL